MHHKFREHSSRVQRTSIKSFEDKHQEFTGQASRVQRTTIKSLEDSIKSLEERYQEFNKLNLLKASLHTFQLSPCFISFIIVIHFTFRGQAARVYRTIIKSLEDNHHNFRRQSSRVQRTSIKSLEDDHQESQPR